MTFSPISEFIVLFAMALPFWHMFLIQHAATASLVQRAIVGTMMLGWTGYAYAAARYDIDAILFGDSGAGPAVYIALALGGALGLRGRLLGHGVPQRILIGLQVCRPVGLIYIFESARGTLPAWFAWPAGIGDLITGAVALWVVLRYRDRPVPPRAVILVAAVGFAAFVQAFFFAIVTSANAVQLLAFDNPNRVMTYPFSLIPLFLVPYAVLAHVLSLVQLRRCRAGERAGAGPA